ncbi:MAG: transporter substrate-binding domain-containing protein [Bermanella sp.]
MATTSLRRYIITALLAGGVVLASHAKESFTFYTYHNKPPYFTTSNSSGHEDQARTGIYRNFVDYLNARVRDVEVQLEFSPRVRLEGDLRKGLLNGAIIGVNPLWFKDKEQKRYLWSASFMADKDVIVVKAGASFPYAHPRDLVGKSLALPRGLYFWGVSERIKIGGIQVFETNSDLQNLGMVELGRADATIMSILSAQYFMRQGMSSKELHILDTPHDQFDRMILFPKNKKRQFELLNHYIKHALTDRDWLNDLKKIGYVQ